jgi:hypothetical protein
MPRAGEHHLETFIRRTFGSRMGAILLAGYGGEGGCRETVGVTGVSESGEETEWLIEILGDLPRGDEPLVLAALLKLLLTRGPLDAALEFTLEEALAELGWPDGRSARDTVDAAVSKYSRLTYAKADKRGAVLGVYALVIGYDHITERGLEDNGRTRILNRVQFHPRFVDGLRNLKIVFAGIEFGDLGPIDFPRRLSQLC